MRRRHSADKRGGTRVALRAGMHDGEGSRPSARLRDRAFREALQRCEDCCQAVSLVSFALALAPDAGDAERRLRDCWRTATAVASALAHFDRIDPAAMTAMLAAGERAALQLAATMQTARAPATMAQIDELALDCARQCAVLAGWLAPVPARSAS